MKKNWKLLAVDDEVGIVEYLTYLFETAGFEVKSANGGWAAWEMIAAEAFDFVMTDVRMEHGDGIELVEKIRNMDGPKPKIAVMSAYSDLSTADVFERGAVGLVQKPPRSDKLLEFVIGALQPPEQRWDNKKAPINETQIRRSFPSYEEAIKSGQVAIGSGGMFIQLSENFPVIDANVEFHLTFASGAPKALKGRGCARWVRAACLKIFHTGTGVEFTSLDDGSKEFIIGNLEKNQPESYIPVGQRPSR